MWSLTILVSILLATQCDLIPTGEYATENRLTGLFQGDIMIRDSARFMERSATTNKEARWPNGIVPYIFDDTFSESDREAIRLAMDEFEKHTCIKWIEKTDEEAYIVIENDLGCYAELGRTGGPQSLSLERGYCLKKGVMMHEMMHALGFWHEHTRPDRDDYVQVEWDNIESGMEPNFEKMTPRFLDTLGLDYDYRSLLHYSAYNFAVDRSQPTLRPKADGVGLEDLGYGELHAELSELDIAKINKFYECPSKGN